MHRADDHSSPSSSRRRAGRRPSLPVAASSGGAAAIRASSASWRVGSAAAARGVRPPRAAAGSSHHPLFPPLLQLQDDGRDARRLRSRRRGVQRRARLQRRRRPAGPGPPAHPAPPARTSPARRNPAPRRRVPREGAARHHPATRGHEELPHPGRGSGNGEPLTGAHLPDVTGVQGLEHAAPDRHPRRRQLALVGRQQGAAVGQEAGEPATLVENRVGGQRIVVEQRVAVLTGQDGGCASSRSVAAPPRRSR